MEFVIIVDVLRRAGVQVTTASVMDEKQVVCSRKTNIVADALLDECTETYDLIALPGGMPGAENLRDCAKLKEMLTEQKSGGRWCAAVCAAPAVVFHAHGILDGVQATCNPGFEFEGRLNDRVVVSGNVVTSQAPGTSMEFAVKLVECLLGPEKAKATEGPLLNAASAMD